LDEYPTPEDVTLMRFYRMPFDKACRGMEQDTSLTTSPVVRTNVKT